MATKGLWLVMDARARVDTDRASVLEALHEGIREEVPRKAARIAWQGQDATLCFAPRITDKQLDAPEYVEDVDPKGSE